MRKTSPRRLGLLGAASLLALAAATAGARGQTPYLVTDLTPGEGGRGGSSPSALFAAGSHVFFVTDPDQDRSHSELWATDGTPAGTRRLAEPCTVTSCLYPPTSIASLGNVVFLTGDPYGPGPLWRSDGTPAGTFPLPGINCWPLGAVTLGDVLYLTCGIDRSKTLWRLDGTVQGSRLLANLGGNGGLPDDLLLAAGGRLFFLAPPLGSADNFDDLWTSDGTTAGTAPIGGFSKTFLNHLAVAGSRLVFFAMAQTSRTAELWASDGTKTGTRRLMSQTFTQVTWIRSAGRRVYFVADDGTHGPQLWASDGTGPGTLQLTTVPTSFGLPDANGFQEVAGRPVFVGSNAPYIYSLWTVSPGSAGSVADLCAGNCGHFPVPPPALLAGAGRAFFVTESFSFGPQNLWTSDGTPGGTAELKKCPGRCRPISTIAGALYFGVEDPDPTKVLLWRTDGTPAGTLQVADVPLATYPSPLVAGLAGKAFFAGFDDSGASASTIELFASDGMPGGTRQLTDTTDPLSSSPTGLVAAGGQVFFDATVPPADAKLWRSAGTADSTLPAALGPAPGTPPPVAAFGGIVFLQYSTATLQLWRSDGTAAGTQPLTSFSAPLSASANAPPVGAGGQLYFAVESQAGGAAIWRSDGTPQGTAQLFALPPAIVTVGRLAVFGGDFYFAAAGNPSGGSYWHSDGTTGGTVKLTFDWGREALTADPGFASLGNKVYFIASGAGGFLYQTDGTAAGTSQLSSFISCTGLTATADAIYFFADGGRSNPGLWRSDGTAAGTVLLHPFLGGSDVFDRPLGLVPFGGGFAFAANDGVHGMELWTTDGTASGTRLVSDVLPGTAGSVPTDLVAAGGRLYFSANDGVHGRELWESDGTAAGTRLVQDINPGPVSSNPSGMTAAGGLLFFAADDGLTGRELWALPLAPGGGGAGCQASATALCLAGGRFKVEAFWRDFQGHSGPGQAQPLTGDTGTFWFFNPNDVEVIVKVLDGRALDGAFWVFYGALSNVEYYLTVTDTATGEARRYYNPLGQLASVGDTSAFPAPPSVSPPSPAPPAAARPSAAQPSAAPTSGAQPSLAHPAAPQPAAACQPGPARLCLEGGRFAIEASWTDFNGRSGTGTAVALTGETGYFWFFSSGNVETVLKVIDGRAVNNHFWVFYGALSDVQYTLTVTDTATGAVKTYTNPAGQFASVADTSAF
jgi:ELWxxDGT repeat protein